ncbi:type III pantothenate kinase [Maridesulfovibrio ferrireducens]|uniref:Type III pantothenate kinase n=1 Tax=Maridesulfovibrio ferrireducens TaxID=246191 RepID=A0A1G9D3H4_9BACT|nr:type III pantothenate kinase [Maridesulfovibrio ferrireducens]SDK58459.1 type III pantothenate kinase [Maridesulfovibrio ferrireducens]
MSSETIFLFDVGNTNTKIGFSTRNEIGPSFVLPTDPGGTADSWGLRLLEICRVAGYVPEDIVGGAVSSVVPPMNPILRSAVKRFFSCDLNFFPEDIKLNIDNRYERPWEVGADRLVTAFSGRCISDSENIIVVDFGTATTFDCVVGNAYMGGLICPGVLSSTKALSSGTAKLPHITLELETNVIRPGKSTADSLNQGLIFGFAAMVEGLSQRLSDTLGGEVELIATGGFASKIAEVCRAIDRVEPTLLLDGLRMGWFGIEE